MNRIADLSLTKRVAVFTMVGMMAMSQSLATGHHVFAATPTDDASATTKSEEALSFRRSFGLEATDAIVQQSLVDPAFSDADWGVPLSATEIADLNHRVEVQEAIDPAFATAQSLGTSGGVYLDQLNGGIPVFLTTEDPAEFATALATLVPRAISYMVERVSFSISELYAVQAEIDADTPKLLDDGVDIGSTAIDVINNRVLVGVRSLGGGDLTLLQHQYGAAISVEEEQESQGGDSCTSRASCPPIKGGINIYLKDHPEKACTSGVIVRKSTGPVDLYVLTAGHCIEKNGGVGARWKHDSTVFGTAVTEAWGNLSDADVGLIDIDNGDYPSTMNEFYAQYSWSIRAATTWQVSDHQNVGDAVCRSGEYSGYHCGTIVNINKTKDVDGKQIKHQWVMDSDACPGDSGGPYFIGLSIYGIHSDSTDGCNPGTNRAWYSPIDWALAKLSSKGWPSLMCFTSNCQ